MPRGSSLQALLRYRAAFVALNERFAIYTVVRALDDARSAAGLSKAELARRIGVRPAAMRRLLSTLSPNPTLKTLVRMATALGLAVEIVGAKPPAPARKRRKR